MNLDLTDFNIREYPITKKMKIMTEHNTNPLYYFLYDTFHAKCETQQNIYISGKNIFSDILYYFENEGYNNSKLNARNIKSFLLNIQNNPITYKVKRVKSVTNKISRGYEINIKKLLDTIKPLI